MMSKGLRTKYFQNKKDRMKKRNLNWIVVVVGTVGSGKTYGAIEISDEMMDRKHDPNIHEIFSIEEFMYNYNRRVYEKGDVLVFEEAGVNISSKNWQSKANKNINFVLQTCRHRNFSIIFTLPMFKFLDASTRALIHTVFIADEKNIDYEKKISYLKVYDFKVDALNGKEPYKIIPKFWVDGVLIAMRRVAVKMPREEILTVYEKRKMEFTNKLNKEIEEQLIADKEAKIKVKKAKPCDVCGHTQYRHRTRTDDWKCYNGHITYIDPFMEVKKDA